MNGHVDDSLLRNCTAMVLTIEFECSSKDLIFYNSSELLAILGEMLKSSDMTMSKRTMAKDRLHDCVYPVAEPSHNISFWHKLLWSTCFIAMLIVAIVGNSIVIWIVIGKQRTIFAALAVHNKIYYYISTNLHFTRIIRRFAHLPKTRVYDFAAILQTNSTIQGVQNFSLQRY